MAWVDLRVFIIMESYKGDCFLIKEVHHNEDIARDRLFCLQMAKDEDVTYKIERYEVM